MTISEQEQRLSFGGAFDTTNDWVEVADDLPGYDDDSVGEFLKLARNGDDLFAYD